MSRIVDIPQGSDPWSVNFHGMLYGLYLKHSLNSVVLIEQKSF